MLVFTCLWNIFWPTGIYVTPVYLLICLRLLRGQFFLSVLLLRMVVFFNRGCTFFSLKKPTSTLLYFYLNFGERDWKVHFSALEFLIFWLVDKIVINYTCPVDKFIMLLVKMGFLGILAQRRRHLKVFTRDVNVYTKWKEKITFDNREAH